MATQLPISIYKDTIMQSLLKNDIIVKAMAHSVPDFLQQDLPENTSNLIYDTIFPYKHVPDIQEKAKTFVTMALQFKWDQRNRKKLRKLDIYLYVFAHQSLQRTNYGAIRIDMVADEIDKELNGSNSFGVGKLYLADLVEYQMAESEYSGVTMKYSTTELNGQQFFNK